jgi:hypothetical protein
MVRQGAFRGDSAFPGILRQQRFILMIRSHSPLVVVGMQSGISSMPEESESPM